MKLKLAKWLFKTAFKLCKFASNKETFELYYELISFCNTVMNKLEFSKDFEGFVFTKETGKRFIEAIPYPTSITFDKQFKFNFAKQNLNDELLLKERTVIRGAPTYINTKRSSCNNCDNVVIVGRKEMCGLNGNPIDDCNSCDDFTAK